MLTLEVSSKDSQALRQNVMRSSRNGLKTKLWCSDACGSSFWGGGASASRDSAFTCGDEKLYRLGRTFGSQAHVVIVVCKYSMPGHSHPLLRTHKSSTASILAPWIPHLQQFLRSKLALTSHIGFFLGNMFTVDGRNSYEPQLLFVKDFVPISLLHW